MRAALGWVLTVTGTVWVLQGFEVPWAPRSFMTGDWRWIAGGVLTLMVGLAFLREARLLKRESRPDVS